MKTRILLLMMLLPLIFLTGCINIEESDISITIKPGIDTVEINTAFIDAGATAKANNWTIDYDIIQDTVDITKVGTYSIIYETTYRGFTKQAVRMVWVVDETPPVATLLAGIDTIFEGTSWEDAGIEASDNSLEEVTIVTQGVVSVDYIGEYIIKYIVTDASGNQIELIRYVNVVKLP